MSYDAKIDDIDLKHLKDDDDDDDAKDQEYCGVFMNAIYHCLQDNANQNFTENFSNLQDNIIQKSSGSILFEKSKNNKCNVGLSINESGNSMNSIKSRIKLQRFQN